MVKSKKEALIRAQREIAKDIFDMWIETNLAKEAMPGQFVCLYTKSDKNLLPRPISICEVDAKKEAMRIVYRVAGEGTREFSTYQAGDTITVLGNLGNGFPLEEAKGKRAIILGGGIGIPPMLFLANELCGEASVIAGYRDQEIFLEEDFKKTSTFYIATEDGSVGTKGNVITALEANEMEADILFACGPMPMLQAIKTYAEKKGIKAYISLEERMACGVGACLGCVVNTVHKDAHSHVHNARICVDGPVFEAKEVDI